MGIEFNSLEELYKRVTPALNSKVKEFKRIGIEFVKEEDIWNYLVQNKWKKSTNLELCTIVDDILNTNNEAIKEFVTAKFKNIKRDIDFDI